MKRMLLPLTGSNRIITDKLLTFYTDGGLSYDSSYEDCKRVAKNYLKECNSEDVEQYHSLDVQGCVDMLEDSPYVNNLSADDKFDLKIGFKNFCIAVKDLSNGYTPKFRGFRGSNRNGLVSIDAFEFKGHNKELASTHVNYSYLHK